MSVTSFVEKATSDMLIGPDWALNLDLCDAINNDPTQAKEVVKAVKKRLTNRNPQVQLLALTVLETLIKNCGDNVHQQVAEKDVLHELVKLVKKKADMRVRDKTLVLLDSWQEAFGGSSGRYPQYYIAYSELQKAGVEFPRRGGEPSSPIFTPPQSQPLASPRQYGPRTPSPRSPGPPSSRSVDTENFSGMSLAEIKEAQNLVELLQDMVKALNPRDRMSAKEEVIVELVDQCRINQHRVMQLVNVTSDEQLLGQGLSLNDELQRVLARYDAFLSGAPIPETSPERRSPKMQTQTEAHYSPQGAAGTSARPKGSARTIYPGLSIPPPPSTGKRPATQSSSAASAVPAAAAAAASADASFDLLSGDPTYQLLSGDTTPPSSQPEAGSSSSMALTVIDQPQPKQEQKVEDLLALPAPEGFSNPFESSPFQATPNIEVSRPAYPPQSFAETPVLRSENSWAAAPVVGSPRQRGSFYGTQQTESVSGQPVQSHNYYPQPQPVPATPPPWQEDTQVPQVTQSWQAPSQGYGYGGNTAWNSGQQPGMGVMQQQYPGTGYAGYSTQPSAQPSWPSNDSSRLGQVGTGPGENFGSQYLNQRGISYGQSSPYGASQQQYPNVSKPSVKSPDTLFNDLVDFRSVNAKFKAASLANKAPNTSKAGP